MSRRVGSGGVNWALLNIYCSVCFVAYRRTRLLDYKRKAQNIGMESVSQSACLSVPKGISTYQREASTLSAYVLALVSTG